MCQPQQGQADVGAPAAAAAAGRVIPDDFSVVAPHDVALALHTHAALTTVKRPLQQLGRKAIEMIIDDGPMLRGGVVLADDPAPQLIVRGSTAPVRRSHMQPACLARHAWRCSADVRDDGFARSRWRVTALPACAKRTSRAIGNTSGASQAANEQ